MLYTPISTLTVHTHYAHLLILPLVRSIHPLVHSLYTHSTHLLILPLVRSIHSLVHSLYTLTDTPISTLYTLISTLTIHSLYTLTDTPISTHQYTHYTHLLTDNSLISILLYTFHTNLLAITKFIKKIQPNHFLAGRKIVDTIYHASCVFGTNMTKQTPFPYT